MTDTWGTQMEALGAFIRSQRKLANLSLRQLAELSSLSNPYLSQLERGMHQPSVRVLNLLSGALDVSAEMLLAQAGLLDLHPADAPSADAPPPATSVQEAIRADSGQVASADLRTEAEVAVAGPPDHRAEAVRVDGGRLEPLGASRSWCRPIC